MLLLTTISSYNSVEENSKKIQKNLDFLLTRFVVDFKDKKITHI